MRCFGVEIHTIEKFHTFELIMSTKHDLSIKLEQFK